MKTEPDVHTFDVLFRDAQKYIGCNSRGSNNQDDKKIMTVKDDCGWEQKSDLDNKINNE